MSVQRGKELVESALANSKDNIVILPSYAPWKMVLVPSDAEFVVLPFAAVVGTAHRLFQ